MRPDQDERLTSMGIGEPTCEKCMMELYSDASDDVCEDCTLNPTKNGNSATFIKQAAEREGSCCIEELVKRREVIN